MVYGPLLKGTLADLVCVRAVIDAKWAKLDLHSANNYKNNNGSRLPIEKTVQIGPESG